MLLFERRFHQGLVDGAITVTFRRWPTARVKPGGRYRCHPIGVLEIDAVERVGVRDVREADAKRAGFESRDAMLEYLRGRTGPLAADDELWRIELHHGGDGDRVDIALDDRLSAADVDELTSELARMDAKRAWTAQTLRSIERNPRTAASKLAKALDRETAPFKADVVKLKRLGLTQSFEVGYEISPRGRAYLKAIRSEPGPRRRRPRAR